MREAITTITKKGQVTIPAKIRKELGLKPGDKIAFVIDRNGVRIEPSSSTLKAGFGAVKPQKKPEDFQKLRDEAKEWAVRQVEEELQ